MKKRSIKTVILIIVLGVCLSISGMSQKTEDPGVMLRSAIEKEEVDGDLQGAIELYQQIIEKFGGNQAIAAQAQLRIGLCYEKLGSKTMKQAQQAFQKVVDNFPTQSDEVRIAREKLSLFSKTQPASEKKESDFNLEKIWDDSSDSFFMGAPSPDGRYVSFVDWQNFANLGIRDLRKGRSQLLTHLDSWETGESAYQSIFSPDSSKIVYTWQNKKGEGELRTIGIDGGAPRILCKDAGWPEPKSWTKDGSRILVLFVQKESIDLAFVSVKDGHIKKLSSLPSSEFSVARQMSLSLDEKFIAFGLKQKHGQSNLDIYIMSADGNNLTPLISHPANDEVLGWTPDGKQVLFKSDRTGSIALWAIQVEDGKSNGFPQLIRTALGDIQPLGLTQEGSLYFGQNSGWSDIFVAELDPETGKVVSPPVKAIKKYERFNSAPDWSFDGEYLACRSSRGKNLAIGGVALLIRSSQTEEIREVIPRNISGLNFHFIRWSPNGRTILGAGYDENGNYGALWAIDAQTGESEIIARPNENGTIFQPEWAPDGQSVFFVRRTLKTRRIIRLNIATGEEKQLLTSPLSIYSLSLSPDAQQLAFYGDGIMLLSTNGGEPEMLIQEKGVNSLAWSQDGRFLLYGKRHAAKSDIVDVWRIPVKGGEPQKLELSMINLMHLRVHPDGRKIAFTGSLQPGTTEIWKMKNFLPKIDNKK